MLQRRETHGARRQRHAARVRRLRRTAGSSGQQADTSSGGSTCNPNYAGACLKPDSPDYDCAGGSGDGPDYTGTVRIVGVDEYDLDRDGDGIGCDDS